MQRLFGRCVIAASVAMGLIGASVPAAAETTETHYVVVHFKGVGNGQCLPQWLTEPFPVKWPVRDKKSPPGFFVDFRLEGAAIIYQVLDHIQNTQPALVNAMGHELRKDSLGMDVLRGVDINRYSTMEMMNSYIKAYKFYEPKGICREPGYSQQVTKIPMDGFEHKRPSKEPGNATRLGISKQRQQQLYGLMTAPRK